MIEAPISAANASAAIGLVAIVAFVFGGMALILGRGVSARRLLTLGLFLGLAAGFVAGALA